MAKTYGQLPSYVRDTASTYDVMVMDLMMSWENKKYDEANGIKSVPKLSQETMLDMLKRAKES